MVELLSGRYRVGDPIGAGGSAHVFRAVDERLGREVAVKLLDDDAARSADPAARQRFQNEARAGARFVHPNAVTVFDAGAEQGQLFLVMELLSGGSLAERLAESGPMDPAAVTLLGAQVGGALAAGHAAGLIHRDVKPSNVLFADDGIAKLADFGIAHRFDEIQESLTETGMVMGTRQYISPEQAAGRELSGATDQFSLGVTLFEAVTGSRTATAVERQPDDVLDPRRIVRSIPPGLARAISTATAMNPDQRFSAMTDMVESLISTRSEPAADVVTAETATMPVGLRPDGGVDPFGPTDALSVGDGGDEGASVATAPPAEGMSRDLATERRRRRRVVVAAGIGLATVTLGIVAVAATGDDSGDAITSVASPAPSAPAEAATSPTPTRPTSVPSTTTTTTATTTVPATTIAELVAGFPAPAGEREFLTTLQNDPDLAGPKGDALAKRFEEFLDAESDDRDKEADQVRKEIDKWLDKDEIDPTIAAAANTFIERLAPGSDDD